VTELSLPAAERVRRLAAVDLLRGLAVAAMVFYHLSWDLSSYGLIGVDVVNDPPWRAFARLIAGTFLALVGFNLVLATRHGIRWPTYLRRLGIVGVAAILVSIGTYLFLPDSFVFFGILHLIFVASILALPFLQAPLAVIGLAAVFCLAAPSFFTSPFFDAPAFLFLGLSAHPQATLDYVPIFPWFGVVLAGIGIGRLYVDHGLGQGMARWRPAGRLARVVMFGGRWSLPIYLVHQPLMIGTLFLVMSVVGQSEQALSSRFLNICNTNWCGSDGKSERCRAQCGCILTGAQGAGLLGAAMAGTMTGAQSQSWQTIVDACIPPKLDQPATGG
jgi:uncharacterized membrane protein